jgi:hypothetical protein
MFVISNLRLRVIGSTWVSIIACWEMGDAALLHCQMVIFYGYALLVVNLFSSEYSRNNTASLTLSSHQSMREDLFKGPIRNLFSLSSVDIKFSVHDAFLE